MANNQQIVLTNVRLSYVHLTKPYANDPSQEAVYSCTVLVPKDSKDNIAKIDAAIKAAKEAGIAGKWNGTVPPIVPTPVHDGDGTMQNGNAYGAECKGCLVFTAKSKRPIEIVDRRRQPILTESEIYSGIYANICVNFYPYLYQGKKAIGCGLGPVQKVADGESFGGSAPKAASVFSDVADTDDNKPSWL